MNRLLFGTIIFVGLMLSATDAMAQQGKGKGKGAQNAEMRQQEGRAEDAADEAEDRAEQERERAEAAAERAEEERERARERAENEEGFGGDLDNDQARDAGRGNEKSQEMRARREERTAIKGEYQENGEAGQQATEADEADDEQQKKDKKPWWKYWDDSLRCYDWLL